MRFLATLLCLVLAAAPLSRAAPQPGAPRPDGPPTELRQALRDYYLRSVVKDLGIEGARVPEITQRLDALIGAQREAVRTRMQDALQVRSAADGTGDPAAALAGLEKSERQAELRVAVARTALLDTLTPRQAVRFMAFEGQFRQRVRQIMTGGPNSDAEPPGPGLGPGQAPRRVERPGGGAEGDNDGDAGDMAGGMRDTVELIFVHRLRERLALDDARTLALLPKVEAFVDARFESERKRRELVRRLRAAADDASLPDAALAALVKESREVEATGPERLAAARRGVLDALSPREGAQFLVFAFQFEREARRRLMGARPMADAPWRGDAPEGAMRGNGPPVGGGPEPGRRTIPPPR